MTERTESLAAAADEQRNQRERRTAILHALRGAARDGDALPARIVDHFRTRTDGTPATVRDSTPAATSTETNHADHITHAARAVRDDD